MLKYLSLIACCLFHFVSFAQDCSFEAYNTPYTRIDLTTNTSIEEREDLVIPVVVHIVWRLEEQNISETQIAAQLDQLNRDFNAANTDLHLVPAAYQSLVANTNIRFVLATKDEMGNASTGITRTFTEQESIGLSPAIYQNSEGGKTAWNTEHYLNIWVCELFDNFLGYGTLPNTVADKDGVIINYQHFGNLGTAYESTPYHYGRTLTHEIGHYLGLLHPWGWDKGDCDEDDNIADTPFQSRSYYGCPTDTNSCNSNDLWMNFMQESNDECLLMFTKGQRERMRATLMNERSGLLEYNNDNYTIDADNTRLLLVPNPVYGSHFGIKVSHTSTLLGTLEIIDELGRSQMTTRLMTNEFQQINVPDAFDKGIYFVRFVADEKEALYLMGKLIVL